MSTGLPRPLLRLTYERAAAEYSRHLPLEHYMEATAQGRQRAITLSSLELVKADRIDFYLFNELLVQYPYGRAQKLRQVVPDNMVVLSDTPIQAAGSYDIPLQAARPFWMLEYVSKHSLRKDYEDSFRKYERELKVPYYLVFYPDTQDLTLFRLKGSKYVSVRANAVGRHPIIKLELEVAVVDGWVRYWYRGELLPLPAELQRNLDKTRRKLQQVRADLQGSRAETERVRVDLQGSRAETEQARAETERERQEKERLLAQLRALGLEPR